MQKQQLHRQTATVAIHKEESFSGPIPAPDIIQKYEETLPGAADRILTMAEKQSEHRQEMEKAIVKAEIRDSLLGIISGFVIGAGSIATAAVIVISVPSAAGAVFASLMGTAGIGSIVAIFIKGTRIAEKKE